ncbi:hypothetical protein SAMN04487949_2211 [Halogranum gelatinilyticum]|uniref:Uncharacterized protein n=1 Tax=Halogranum gelatinilyticum TaxID=660521 RepID=A0A1G9UJ14_9EURY|nr:hypothetical protein [Halogranum gelatinilyticum]SDM59929.1 hypothetical protein SAMN04487949_2211 [Halogranum gelatinilyticum]
MAVHSSTSDTAHDQGVAREAKELVRAGWSVTATVEGWDDPEPVGPAVPDIVATKRGTVRVVEVETDDGCDHERMRRAVSRRRNAVFYAVIVDDNGRRIRYTDAA